MRRDETSLVTVSRRLVPSCPVAWGGVEWALNDKEELRLTWKRSTVTELWWADAFSSHIVRTGDTRHWIPAVLVETFTTRYSRTPYSTHYHRRNQKYNLNVCKRWQNCFEMKRGGFTEQIIRTVHNVTFITQSYQAIVLTPHAKFSVPLSS